MKPKITAEEFRHEPRFITRTTILILSGWCLGLSSARLVAVGAHWSVFLVGIAGLVAFGGLEYAAWRRKRLAARDHFEQTLEKLDHDRHSEERKRAARVLVGALKTHLASKKPASQ